MRIFREAHTTHGGREWGGKREWASMQFGWVYTVLLYRGFLDKRGKCAARKLTACQPAMIK